MLHHNSGQPCTWSTPHTCMNKQDSKGWHFDNCNHVPLVPWSFPCAISSIHNRIATWFQTAGAPVLPQFAQWSSASMAMNRWTFQQKTRTAMDHRGPSRSKQRFDPAWRINHQSQTKQSMCCVMSLQMYWKTFGLDTVFVEQSKGCFGEMFCLKENGAISSSRICCGMYSCCFPLRQSWAKLGISVRNPSIWVACWKC